MKTKSLDDIFTERIQQTIQSRPFFLNAISRHFEKFGLVLTPEQIESIENQLNISDERDIEIELSDEQVIAITDRGNDPNLLDFDQFNDDFDKEVSRFINETMETVIEQSALDLAADWTTARSDILGSRNRQLSDFRAFLHDVWGNALDALEIFIVFCVDLAEEQFACRLTNIPNNKRMVLARIHARCCQVSSEICTLLRSGFADGAHARWRTLHELVTVGEFLLDAPDEVAEMYIAHADVARAKEAEEFQKRQRSFGYEPISDVEMAELTAAKEEARSKFGTEFLKDYGWATQYLKKRYNKKGRQTSFIDIESAVNESGLRNYYKLANRNIHAGFWGEQSRLGDDPNWKENILLAGPSHFGLSIPAHNTAYSLGLLTIGLLVEDSTFETLIPARTLIFLINEFNDLVNMASSQTKRLDIEAGTE